MREWHAVILLVFALLLIPTIYAQSGGTVIHGSVSGTGSPLTSDISTVNTTQSFILFTSRSSSSTPDDAQFTANFTNSTQVRFERYNTATTTIEYMIVTSPDITVQRGTQALTSGTATHNVAINAIDQNESFIIVDGRCADATNSDSHAGFFTANFTNTTNVLLTRGNAGKCAATVSWQVVSWESTTVRSGYTEIGNSQSSITDDFTTVDNVSAAFLLFSTASIGTDPGMDSNLIQGTLTNGSQVSFTHEPPTTYPNSARQINYFVIEKEGAVQQNGTIAVTGDGTTAINTINISQSFFVDSGWNTGGGQSYANSYITFDFSDTTTITRDKQTGSQTQNVRWYVFDLPDPDKIPNFANESVTPANGTDYSQGTLYQFHITINNTNGTVGLQLGGVNYTAGNSSLVNWNVNISDLPAGDHEYHWWARGTGIEQTLNTTTPQNYTVVKATSNVTAHVNNTRQNITIERTHTIDLNATRLAGEGVIELIHDGTTINQGIGPLHNLTQFLTAGSHNITARHNETENYTLSTETWFVTVQDTIAPNITNIANISITNESVLITWNTDESANSTVLWGHTVSLGNQTNTSTWVTSHSILIENLQPSTQYFYNVTSCDISGNCDLEGTYNFTTLAAPDTTPPTFNNITVTPRETNATLDIELDEAANITINWGYTTSFGNTTVETSYLLNQEVTITNLTELTTYFYNITACDTSDNCNTTGPYNFTTIDVTAPTWSNNRTDPISGTTYTPGADHQFNVTWNDNVAVHTVLIQHNFTGTFQNESVNITGNEYHFNTTDLAAGEYQWKMYANDTTNNLSETDNFTYIINKSAGNVSLFIDETQMSKTVTRFSVVNLTAQLTATGTVELLENDVTLTTGTAPVTNLRNFTQLGVYNITARYNETQNYTADTELFTVTVIEEDPSYPTNVQAENDIVTLSTTQTTLTVALTNTYNLSKAFIVTRHASGFTNTAEPDESTTTVRFNSSGDGVILERYATQSHEALVSYSILQADNIEVINFTKNWASSEEQANLSLTEELTNNYATKCFIETHRNIRINSATISDYAEQEVQATILNTTHINLTRDTEGGGAAAAGVQYGFIVCFLDETAVQTGSYSISGDAGSEASNTLTAVNTTESFATISYYQADDGVGQNALMYDFDTSTNLIIHRDESGGGQTAFGNYFVIDFEDKTNTNVEKIEYQPVPNSILYHTSGGFSAAVDQNKTLLHCENTMTAGGGTAHTRASFVFEINDTNNQNVVMQEGRTRSGSQISDTYCQIIVWPNVTTYAYPADLVVTNITFDLLIEGVNNSVYVNVTNQGVKRAENVTTQLNVSEWNGSTWVNTETLEITTIIIPQGSILLNFSWHANYSGSYQFHAYVDVEEQVNETNETNNNKTINQTVASWQVLYGSISNSYSILRGETQTDFSAWAGLAGQGNIYAADADHTINYLGLAVFNETNDFDEADIALNMTGRNDSIQRTFDLNDDGVADNTKNMNLTGVILAVPVTNSTNSSTFVTGILWDTNETDTSYNGSQQLIFITNINQSQVGKYGTYDYEIRIPATLEELSGSDNTVSLYLEIT